MNKERYNELMTQYLAAIEEEKKDRYNYAKTWEVSNTIFTEFLTNRFIFLQKVRCGAGCGPGWVPLLVDLCTKIEEILAKTPGLSFQVDQIKEKFASLRFYSSIFSEAKDENGMKYEMVTYQEHEDAKEQIHSLIYDAELKSESICETCGAPGTPGRAQGRGWIKTACEEHRNL